MADEEFQEILTAAGFGCTPASPEFLAWLEAIKAPREIISLLAPGLPARQKRRRRVRDHWDLYTEDEIRKEAAEFPRYLKAGLISLGSCVNGDPFALDIRKAIGTVGYISHDEVWEDDEAQDSPSLRRGRLLPGRVRPPGL